MKKTVLYLVVALMFVLAACGNNSEKEQSKSETKGSKETVKIENNYKMRGEKKDGSDAKKVDVILAMDRGQAVSGKSTAKQALNNPVLKNVKAIKEDKVYNLDPKLWYFAAGSTTTTIKQIDELEKVVK
ncbi:TPA: hypothetical protein L0W94_002080 [Staphylococcus aureus]|nr:hypothetical protein [Staphylococcus aureus]HBM8246669.1 hypothetical protein [Staphylococcus aureus]